MPVSIVVGGQYGSEGKGKVAHYFAKELNATCVVRCGGSNSGHTVVTDKNEKLILQHLPTASIIKGVKSFLASGSYIDLDILLAEIETVGLSSLDLFIDGNAVIINNSYKENEKSNSALSNISSTMSGTGDAVLSRIKRDNSVKFAKDVPELQKYICNVSQKLNKHLENNERVLIEGTQGFGLSLLHSPYYPYVTSRDTTAAGFLSECGISPLYVDDIIMVIRVFPIRVSGNSGPLINETTWEDIKSKGNHSHDIAEYTSVTKKLRRVAHFDAEVVKKAINTNNPTKIVLNHLDLLEADVDILTDNLLEYLRKIEKDIDTPINFIGFGAGSIKYRCEDLYTNKIVYSSVDDIPEGMLSSPQIKYCLSKGLLITPKHESDTDDDIIKQVNSAVYQMRFGEHIWGYSKDGKDLDKVYKKGDKVILEPNSLTFVTTWESFNLPKDIIARFNLKSKWVHKGLLLGTGPIVDPEFTDRVLIPLHNFSNSPVQIHAGDNFINVEFTKTLPVETVYDHESQAFTYNNNPTSGYTLEKYVNGLGILSSSSIQEQVVTWENHRTKTEKIQRWSVVGVAISALSLLIAAFAMFCSVKETIENSAQRDRQFQTEITGPLKDDYKKLQDDYNTLSKHYINLESELHKIKGSINLATEEGIFQEQSSFSGSEGCKGDNINSNTCGKK